MDLQWASRPLAITARYEEVVKNAIGKLEVDCACANGPGRKELEACVRKELAE